MLVASTRAVGAAVAFLTRIPVGRWVELDGGDVTRGVVLFPAVGAAVGAVAGLATEGLEGPLPPVAAGALGVGVVVCLTGALHLDALGDTADALGASDRRRALEIMRDSRVGSFGAAAIGIALVVEAALLGSLASERNAVVAFAVAGALSRAVALPLAWALPYARVEGGPGSVLSGRVSPIAAVVAVALAGAFAIGLLGWDGAAATGLVTAVAVLAGVASRAWIGGVTGDTLGAATQVAEIGALAILVGLV